MTRPPGDGLLPEMIADVRRRAEALHDGLTVAIIDALAASDEALAHARSSADALAEALEEIAKGQSGTVAGGGYFCAWCGDAGAECWDKNHPKTCPRTIARAALAAHRKGAGP